MPKVKKKFARVCAACRQMKSKQELLRIVRTPEKTVEIDYTGKKPGRGAYVCLNSECLKNVVKNKRLDKALKIRVDDKVYEELANIVERYD